MTDNDLILRILSQIYTNNNRIILTTCNTMQYNNNRKELKIMTISVRLSEKDTELIKTYAEMNNISLSDLIRNAVLEKIKMSLTQNVIIKR